MQVQRVPCQKKVRRVHLAFLLVHVQDFCSTASMKKLRTGVLNASDIMKMFCSIHGGRRA
jgi:hypothetical protein